MLLSACVLNTFRYRVLDKVLDSVAYSMEVKLRPHNSSVDRGVIGV